MSNQSPTATSPHQPPSTLTIQFTPPPIDPPHTATPTYTVRLRSPDVGEASAPMTRPWDLPTWRAIQLALEPNFTYADAPPELRAILDNVGDPRHLKQTVGEGLTAALLEDKSVCSLFDRALALAASNRATLPVELRFAEGCDEVAALPWELIRYEDRFLVADTAIALARYPEGMDPQRCHALADLPLRVLLVLSEPLDASPIFPQRAREELLHGSAHAG